MVPVTCALSYLTPHHPPNTQILRKPLVSGGFVSNLDPEAGGSLFVGLPEIPRHSNTRVLWTCRLSNRFTPHWTPRQMMPCTLSYLSYSDVEYLDFATPSTLSRFLSFRFPFMCVELDLALCSWTRSFVSSKRGRFQVIVLRLPTTG